MVRSLASRRVRPTWVVAAALGLAASAPATALAGGGAGLGGSGSGGSGSGGSGGHRPVTSGTLVIRGGGAGHGVGMSQYGAEGFALHGASAAAILAHYYTGTALGQVSPARTIRVLLGVGPSATVSGASRAGATRLRAAVTYTVRDAGVGVILTTGRGHRLAGPATAITVRGRGPLRVAGGHYRGTMRFTATDSGAVQTVEVVGLDAYVRGVVPQEMSPSWAPAALEAQAIAARTYAITTTPAGPGFDVYDDTRSQVYGGVGAQTAPTNAAVTATAGEVVTYQGRPAFTPFFASSGGYTESIQNVWSGSPADPWLVGVPDPYDGAAGDPYHHWRVQLSLRAATAKLGALVDGRLKRIVITQRGVSPRVMAARVIGTRGVTTVTGDQLAAAFDLPSTDMTFTVG